MIKPWTEHEQQLQRIFLSEHGLESSLKHLLPRGWCHLSSRGRELVWIQFLWWTNPFLWVHSGLRPRIQLIPFFPSPLPPSPPWWGRCWPLLGLQTQEEMLVYVMTASPWTKLLGTARTGLKIEIGGFWMLKVQNNWRILWIPSLSSSSGHKHWGWIDTKSRGQRILLRLSCTSGFAPKWPGRSVGVVFLKNLYQVPAGPVSQDLHWHLKTLKNLQFQPKLIAWPHGLRMMGPVEERIEDLI